MREWTYKDLVTDALTRVREVSCEALSAQLTQGVLLDVREPDETASGVLPGAVLLPRGLLEKHLPEHVSDKDRTVYVYCATGNRSALAADVMQRMGYRQVWNVAGGIERWRALGFSIVGGEATSRAAGAKLDWQAVRREFAIVGRLVPVLGAGERPLVYLDHAASTHAPASVLKAYLDFMERDYANVHRGTHVLSRRATERFEAVYREIAAHIGADLTEGCVCLVQNTTQAIDLCSHVMASRPGVVITTEMEHHSNELAHRRRGEVLRCRVTDTGELDLGHLEELLRTHRVKLVAVTAASNVTGVMPDVHRIAQMAHAHGALILVDAAQALARLPIAVKDPRDDEHLDFVATAGHKAYAPFGAAFLYGPRALMDAAPPYLPGGGTTSEVTPSKVEYLPAPDRHVGGTPNIGGAVAMASALQFLHGIGFEAVRAHEVALTHKILDGLERIGGITVYGPTEAARRLGIVSFNVDGVSELMTAAVLSEEGGIAVRAGRFCAHLHMERLLAFERARRGGAGEAPHTGAVRASVGVYNDDSDVDRLLEMVRRVRDRQWRGNYTAKGRGFSAELAGRCADRWLEAGQPAEALGEEIAAPAGYVFESLQPEDGCKSYLVADPESGEAAIIDPLRDRVDAYLDMIAARRYRLKYTIETHTHTDHISGSLLLRERTGAKMAMHEAAALSCVDQPLDDRDVLTLGRLRIEVLATPGHSADAVCLRLPDRLLSGDTLLIGGCGRTDLPTGDAAALHLSLQRLLALPDATAVFPAHDYEGRRASTLARERRSNPRLHAQSTAEFVAALQALELAPPENLGEVLAANRSCK
jgi:selenocysteine lyase/cysteine desulfurase/glyoxylase-like metal-dependent hydrolase (beta-lactamase superfamily II)/rhodanese-related sulfurtransferase